jgi:hypothetical protein
MATEVLALSPRETFGPAPVQAVGLVASPAWEILLLKLKAELRNYGFHIAAPLAVDW